MELNSGRLKEPTYVIGVAGGIASGKSLVSQRLAQLGGELIDADQIGHGVLREPEVKQALRHRWGDAILDGEGEIDRKQVAKIVFAPPHDGPAELAYLETVTHPRIGQRIHERCQDLARENRATPVILDAAVMFKAGWDRMCDMVVFVDAPREVRRERAARRGWREAEFAVREAAQESLDIKRRRADVIIDNSSTTDHLYAQVDRFWQSLEHHR